MCHLLLLMPVIGLSVVWVTPLSFAIPFYIVIALMSALLYWLMAKSMRKPIETGVDSLIGIEAEVLSKLSPGHRAQYLVRSRGELWTAGCAQCPPCFHSSSLPEVKPLECEEKRGEVTSPA